MEMDRTPPKITNFSSYTTSSKPLLKVYLKKKIVFFWLYPAIAQVVSLTLE
jgi:hypothetical protein